MLHAGPLMSMGHYLIEFTGIGWECQRKGKIIRLIDLDLAFDRILMTIDG